MAKIYHIFGGISQHELKGILDEAGFLTIKGRKLLERIGVEIGERVSIGLSTIQNLVNLYNGWKTPERPIDPESELIIGKYLKIPEDDIFLWNKVEELKQTYKMGIKIARDTKIGDDVVLGLGVSIGKSCEISEKCELDLFSTIHDRVFLGKAVFIGKDSDIESGSQLMDRVTITPRSVVKENSIISKGTVFKENKKYQKF